MFKSISAILLLLLSLIGSAHLLPFRQQANNTDERIAGGAEVVITQFPWQLSLRQLYHPRQHRCGASLILPNRALTAARCFNIYSTPGGYAVIGGSTYLQPESGSFQSTLERIIFHPRFNLWGREFANDIAVLWLVTSAPTNARIRPIRLPAENTAVPYGAQAYLAGWGITTSNGQFANRLRYTVLPTITNAQCNSVYPGRILGNMVCAGGQAGRGSCNGDHGGALVINGYQVGISSWGFCGGANRPSVFTRIATEVKWIRSVV